MGKIKKLDDFLSNKIAAGEVVERPASVVKELVENSIDGGSTRIQVVIEEAGLSSIRIIDNGKGIASDDIEVAFERHATSKIKDENDLFRIRTLGFRGEALPSIASVSQLEMKTCEKDEIGTLISLKGGNVEKKEASSCRVGTDITVKNLFFNTPARLKYMKSINTELGHITDVMNRMALSHPNISFSLSHNGRQLLQTSGNGDAKAVMAAIYGLDVAKKLVYIEDENLDFTLKGYVALPEINRASRSYISTMINGRYVKNYSLLKAVQNGYHTLLPIGRYPICYLQVEMEPLLVDVNVHPSKLEVRFSKEEELQQFIEQAIKKAFKKETLIPSGVPTKKREEKKDEQTSFSFTHSIEKHANDNIQPVQKEERNRPFFSQTESVKEAVVVSKKDDSNEDEINSFLPFASIEQPKRKELTGQVDAFSTTSPLVKKENGQSVEAANIIYEEKNHANIEETSEGQLDESAESSVAFESATEIKDEQAESESVRIPPMYPVGQVHGTYIVAQNENGMYLIDQHAAQERIKYEYFKEKVGQVSEELQQVLVPIVVSYSANEAMKIDEHKDKLKEVGIFIEPFGHNTFVIKEHPTWFPKGQEQYIIESMIQEVLNKQTVSVKALREEAAIMMSCKASIKANHFLKNEEMFALLETLRKTESPFTCPHGRPIIISFTTYELEKMFKRIM